MANDDSYTQRFYQSLDLTSAPSARKILPDLFKVYQPDSVIDIGCGDGSWLKAAESFGTKKILGVDGPWIKAEQSKLNAAQFVRAALSENFLEHIPDHAFDLAISLEVAEHIPASSAESFVAQLSTLAPVVLFSAAVPGQGGTGHVNEQHPEYWAAIFARHGYQPLDHLRWAHWEDDHIAWWYKQNIIVYAKDSVIAANPGLQEWARETRRPLPSVVHPVRFIQEQKLSNPTLSRWVKMLPMVISREISRKRPRRAA